MVTRAVFPQELQSLRQLMPTLLDILEAGKTEHWYAFIWLEQTTRQGYSAGRSEGSEQSSDRGMVFRVMIDGVNYEKSTNQLEEKHLIQLAKDFRQSLENQMAVETGYQPKTWQQEVDKGLYRDHVQQLPKELSEKSEVTFASKCDILPSETTMSTINKLSTGIRDSLLRKTEQYLIDHVAKGYQPFADIKIMLRQAVITHVFVDRQKNMAQVLPTTVLVAMAISRTGQMGRCVLGGMGGLEIAELSPQQEFEVIETGFKLSKAKMLVPGRYPIITGPDVTGVIAHEAFGHTQEGDTWMKGRSIAQNLRKDGVKVGNEQATIINQANVFSMGDMDYGTNGSYFFDHEGELARAQTILDQGHLSEPMTDLASSLHLGVPRTANGKRESWRRPLMTRQTNTFFTPGDKTLSELISMVDYGFLAPQAAGGMEDPKGGSLTAGSGYLEEIKDGELTGNLFLGPTGGHVELSDPVFDLLDKIVAKSNSDNEEGIPENKFGGCGKYHKELVPAGCGGPYILWENINCG